MGFEALGVTGYGTVASHLGLPDAGLASYADMVGRVEAMARLAKQPLIADGDTGYGGLLNVSHRPWLRAGGRRRDPTRGPGISQEMRAYARTPRHCGRRDGAEDQGRFGGAHKSQFLSSPAPTREPQGVCRRRSGAPAPYADAGADVLFIELPESEDELATIGRELGDKPLHPTHYPSASGGSSSSLRLRGRALDAGGDRSRARPDARARPATRSAGAGASFGAPRAQLSRRRLALVSQLPACRRRRAWGYCRSIRHEAVAITRGGS